MCLCIWGFRSYSDVLPGSRETPATSRAGRDPRRPRPASAASRVGRVPRRPRLAPAASRTGRILHRPRPVPTVSRAVAAPRAPTSVDARSGARGVTPSPRDGGGARFGRFGSYIWDRRRPFHSPNMKTITPGSAPPPQSPRSWLGLRGLAAAVARPRQSHERYAHQVSPDESRNSARS